MLKPALEADEVLFWNDSPANLFGGALLANADGVCGLAANAPKAEEPFGALEPKPEPAPEPGPCCIATSERAAAVATS